MEDEDSLCRQVDGLRAELDAMRRRYVGVLEKSEAEAAGLRSQVVGLQRELAEARLAETEARHETEGLRHLARIVEAQHEDSAPASAASAVGERRRQGVEQPRSERPAHDAAVLSKATPDVRELLEQSHADLERTYAELRWWEEHGPQLVHRSDDLAMQLENASRASSEAAAQVAHLRTQLQAAHEEEHGGRAERASLQQACVQLQGRLDDVEGGKAELEELVRRLAAQQHASAARERDSYQAKLRLSMALNGTSDGDSGWDHTDLASLATRAEGMQKEVEEAAASLSEAQTLRARHEQDIEQLHAQLVQVKGQRDHQRDAAKRWRAMAEQADAVAAIGLQHQPGQRSSGNSSRASGTSLRLVSAGKGRSGKGGLPPRSATDTSWGRHGDSSTAAFQRESSTPGRNVPAAPAAGTAAYGATAAAINTSAERLPSSLTSSSPSITQQLMMHLQSPMPGN
jgi:chromosome segregation ATPase